MKDTQTRIIEAALTLFSNKEYASVTTLEISKLAGVSEMTLFRHFQTKENLMRRAVQQAVGLSLESGQEMDLDVSFSTFLQRLMHEKLTLISKHLPLIRLFLRESFTSPLAEAIAYPQRMAQQVMDPISRYLEVHAPSIDPARITELMIGFLLRYAMMESNPTYHLWTKEVQDQYWKRYGDLISWKGDFQ